MDRVAEVPGKVALGKVALGKVDHDKVDHDKVAPDKAVKEGQDANRRKKCGSPRQFWVRK